MYYETISWCASILIFDVTGERAVWCQLNYTSIENATRIYSFFMYVVCLGIVSLHSCARVGACANDMPSLNALVPSALILSWKYSLPCFSTVTWWIRSTLLMLSQPLGVSKYLRYVFLWAMQTTSDKVNYFQYIYGMCCFIWLRLPSANADNLVSMATFWVWPSSRSNFRLDHSIPT
jgi:hypothetical protein